MLGFRDNSHGCSFQLEINNCDTDLTGTNRSQLEVLNSSSEWGRCNLEGNSFFLTCTLVNFIFSPKMRRPTLLLLLQKAVLRKYCFTRIQWKYREPNVPNPLMPTSYKYSTLRLGFFLWGCIIKYCPCATQHAHSTETGPHQEPQFPY